VARQLLGRESIFEHVRRLAEVVPGERVVPPESGPDEDQSSR